MDSSQTAELDHVRRFVRVLAHDANNLTGAILALSELLEIPQFATPERTADIASRIRKASWHLQVKINQPVAVDHLVAGRRGNVSMQRMYEIAHDFASSLATRKIAIDVTPPEGDARSAGTPLLFAIVVFNLLRNAIEALGDGEGGITIGISSCQGAESSKAGLLAQRGTLAADRRYIRLSVEDTGSGPLTDLDDQMFVPFITSDRTGRRLGLGLHYVETIAVGLGGAVLVRRDAARTTAEIFVPVAGEEMSKAREDSEGSADALRHVAVIAGDETWASRFTALAAPLGAQVSFFADWKGISTADIENGCYSAIVIADARVDPAFVKCLNDGRLPFLVVTDSAEAVLGDYPEDIRPFNIIAPADDAAAEALHRLVAFGAVH